MNTHKEFKKKMTNTGNGQTKSNTQITGVPENENQSKRTGKKKILKAIILGNSLEIKRRNFKKF